VQYSEFNRTWLKYGRISRIESGDGYVTLQLKSEEIPLQFPIKESYSGLKINDWVAIDSNNEIKSIAPSLRAPLKEKVDFETLKNWSLFLISIRDFFTNEHFVELFTPTLVKSPGTEPTLDVFETQLRKGSLTEKRFFPTSPELHLKKALSLGFSHIFEIARCYRNNEISEIHQPEFWLLEWYRSFANIFDLQADVVRLIKFLCYRFNRPQPDIKCFTIKQLFKKVLSYNLTPQTSKEDLRSICEIHGIRTQDSYSIDDFFHLLMIEKIEPQIPTDALVFVEKYPPFQAALARKDHQGWAQRFEVYWQGMELANAFDELNDPIEQRKRSQEDLNKRSGLAPIGLDEEFFQALESGMPPSAGIALGLDRLFLILAKKKQISEIRLFSEA
jgi:elongation factor P--(R)-beta-lysine ligase